MGKYTFLHIVTLIWIETTSFNKQFNTVQVSFCLQPHTMGIISRRRNIFLHSKEANVTEIWRNVRCAVNMKVRFPKFCKKEGRAVLSHESNSKNINTCLKQFLFHIIVEIQILKYVSEWKQNFEPEKVQNSK
jgi:hypothetical protein